MNKFKLSFYLLFLLVAIPCSAKTTKMDLGHSGEMSITLPGFDSFSTRTGETVSSSTTMPMQLTVNSKTYFDVVDQYYLEPMLSETIASGSINRTFGLGEKFVIIDHEKIPLLQTRGKKTKKDDSDDRYVCVLDLYVAVKNPSVTVGIDKDVFNFSSVGENELNLALDLGTTELNGRLEIITSAQCIAEFVPDFDLINTETNLRIKNLSGALNITFEVVGDDLKIKELSDVSYQVGDLDISTGDLSGWDEFAVEQGLDLSGQCKDFALFKDESMSDIETCVIGIIYDELKINKDMKKDLLSLAEESMPEAILSSLKFKFSAVDLGVSRASGEVDLTSFGSRATSPVLSSAWNMTYTLQSKKDPCSSNLTTSALAGSLGDVVPVGDLLSVHLPYAFAHNLGNAHALSGVFCLTAEYTNDAGLIFNGQIKPRGNMTVGAGTYEYSQILFSDYQSSGAALLDGHSTEDSPTTESSGVPSKATLPNVAHLQERQWEMSVTTETEAGILMKLPSSYTATTSLPGEVLASIDIELDLNVAGKVETLDNGNLGFVIKQVWVDNLSGEASGGVTINLSAIENAMNNTLSARYYYVKRITQDYYQCTPESGEVLLNLYGMRQTSEEENCGTNCELDSGSKLTDMNTTEFKFYSVDWVHHDSHFSIGLDSSPIDDDYDTGCSSFDPNPEYTNAWMQEQADMARLMDKITKWAIQQGMIQAQQEMESVLNQDFTDFWKNVVIDESLPTHEELAIFQTERFGNLLETIQLVAQPTYDLKMVTEQYGLKNNYRVNRQNMTPVQNNNVNLQNLIRH